MPDKKLWNVSDKLRSALDAAQYKHAVLGLLFVKYVSDAFDIRRPELIKENLAGLGYVLECTGGKNEQRR